MNVGSASSEGADRPALATAPPPAEDVLDSTAYVTGLPRFLARLGGEAAGYVVDLSGDLVSEGRQAAAMIRRIADGVEDVRDAAILRMRFRDAEGEPADLGADARAFAEAVGGADGAEQWIELREVERDRAHAVWCARNRVADVADAEFADAPGDMFYDFRTDEYGSRDDLVEARGLHSALGNRPSGEGADASAWDAEARAYTRKHAVPYLTVTAEERWAGLSRESLDDLVGDWAEAEYADPAERKKAFVDALCDEAVRDVEDNHHEDAADGIRRLGDLEKAGEAFALSPASAEDLATFHEAVAAWNARQVVASRYPVAGQVVPAFPDVTIGEVRAYEAARLAEAERAFADVPGMLRRPAMPRAEVMARLPANVEVVRNPHGRSWRWTRFRGIEVESRAGPFPTFEAAVEDLYAS